MVSIKQVIVHPTTLSYQVAFKSDAPYMTNQDIEAVNRIYHVMPGIAEHRCFGDSDETFKSVMAHTELAHLLEHMVIELLARTGRTQGIAFGKTVELSVDEAAAASQASKVSGEQGAEVAAADGSKDGAESTENSDGAESSEQKEATGSLRVYETTLDCPDDTLTMAAVSAAVWVLNWALAGAKSPSPNLTVLVQGLCKMIDRIDRVPFNDTVIAD